MKTKRALIVGTLVAFTTGMTAASMAVARSEHGAPVDASMAAVTMSQAVATAEQQAGGKATHARIENDTGKLVYEIRVADKDKVTRVKVDAQDGKVLASAVETHAHKRSGSDAEKQ